MITRLNEAVESFLDDLQCPFKACSGLNAAFSEALAEKWDQDLTSSVKDFQSSISPLSESIFAVQFHNSLEDVGNAFDGCRQTIVDGLKTLANDSETSLTGLSSGQVKWASVMLLLAKELQTYHLAVSNSLLPVVSSLSRYVAQDSLLEDKEKSGIILGWKSVHEVNKLLRIGYGLSDNELSVILAWMHGEDLSESTRKTLNHQVDSLLQIYRERLCKSSISELDVPVAFNCDPTLIKDVLKDCCSVAEISSAIGQRIPTNKEELESLLHRELPRIPIVINSLLFEIASPGKAFENTKQKMHAVRDIVNDIAQSQNLSASKEQLDLFCMRVLATVCTSVANAASRVAVLMAFGKVNLVQVKPLPSRADDKQPHINVSEGTIGIDVPSAWWLVEDSTLFSSLCREQSRSLPIATVDATYQVSIDAKAFLEKRIEPLPIVHVRRLPLASPPVHLNKKDPTFQKQFSLRTKLSKATKLFNRRSGIQKGSVKDQTGSGQTAREECSDPMGTTVAAEEKGKETKETSTDDGRDPVPPPRPRRKARKSKRAKSEALRKERAQQRALEEAKKETDWFLSSAKAKSPAVQALKGSKGQKVSASVASFEELQEVIDFLSGSSSSSLCLTGTPEADKSSGKDSGSSASKLTKEECHHAAEVKKDSGSEENSEVPEEKGKSSPVDSGLGSTASFLSSLSSTSTINVLASDSNAHLLTECSAAIPEIEDTSELEEKASKETLHDFDGKTSSQDIETKESSINSQDHINNIKSDKDEVANDVDVGAIDVLGDKPCTTINEGKDIDKAQQMGEIGSSELEIWKDPGIVEPFDFMLEGPDSGEPEDGHCLPVNLVKEEITLDQIGEGPLETDPDDCLSPHLHRMTKTLSNTSLKGSTESLYYSAWSLNEFPNKRGDESVQKDEETGTPSSDANVPILPSAIGAPSTQYQTPEMKEDSHCQQYDPFNSPHKWHDIMGGNLGLLWSEGNNTKVADDQTHREPWARSSNVPPPSYNFTTEGTALEGSRLSQWTVNNANKKASLGTPLGGSWQSRSNPDVQRTLSSAEQKMRFERAPSPLLSSRSEIFSASNWPGHNLSRRGSFPRALHRDSGSPRENPLFMREGLSPRDIPVVRSDVSPNPPVRSMMGAYNVQPGANQPSPMWHSNSEGKYWMRHDAAPGASSAQTGLPFRNRVSQAMSLPLGAVRNVKEGDSWSKANLTPGNSFPAGQPLTDPGLVCKPGNFPSHEGSSYALEPGMFLPFRGNAPQRDQLSNRYPQQKRSSLKDQIPLEAQLMLQANRLGQANRNPRPDPRFPDSFQLWNMPK